MDTLTIDLETTSVDGNPSCWDARNRVVLYGWKVNDDAVGTSAHTMAYLTDVLLVGQNLSFDLSYLIRDGVYTCHTVPKNIWDIQLAEYLLTGQTRKYAAMDEMAEKYGFPLKDDKVKLFFDKGLGADAVPAEMLKEYLVQDVDVTYSIFKKQLAAAEEKGMMSLITSQMRARWATILMECNGLTVDWDYVDDKATTLGLSIDATLQCIADSVSGTPWPKDVEFNPLSNKHVSALFFGSPIKWKEKVDDGFYKNGNKKTKVVDREWRNLVPLKHPSGAKLNSRNEYPVDDDVLKNVKYGVYGSIANSIRTLRTFKKWKETYYENLRSFRSSVDGRIHPSLNHTATDTGRLSCTKPNIQNQTTEGGIKDAYISRWGDEGMLLDIDYSQLEVAGLAAITGDKQLISDINSGTDIHIALFKDMYGYVPSKEERKSFKPRTFLTIYGGGPNALSTQTGISKEEAKKFIEVFYKRYPGVQDWHNTMVSTAKKERRVTRDRSPTKKLQIGAYVYKSITGRRYVFKEWENDWSRDLSFSPTQLKNWAVQGFATGDVVPHMLGHICSALYDVKMLQHIVPICTVHDSLLFDVRKDHIHLASESLCAILNQTKAIVEDWFNISDLKVSFKVEANAGATWGTVATII